MLGEHGALDPGGQGCPCSSFYHQYLQNDRHMVSVGKNILTSVYLKFCESVSWLILGGKNAY